MALLRRPPLRRWLRQIPLQVLRFGRAGGGRAGGVLNVWVWYERLTTRRWDVKAIRPGGLLRYSLGTYRGAPITLRDGTKIRPGDRIVEIHLDNAAFSRLLTVNRSPFEGLRRSARDLQALHGLIASGDLGAVRALHGISLFTGLTPRLGFEEWSLPRTPYWALVRYFMVGLLIVYHPDGFERARQLRDSVWPGEIWMSWAALDARYRRRV